MIPNGFKNLSFLALTVFALTLLSCKKEEPVVKAEKKLDTSFLKMGKISETPETSSDLLLDGHIHVLNDSQDITIVNREGLIKISDFDYSKLKDGDIVIGNEKDRYLFKYPSAKNTSQNTGIYVEQGAIDEINRKSDSKISLDFTPELDFLASEEREYDKINLSEEEIEKLKQPELNPEGLNIINFKNYELFNIKGRGQVELKLGKKTKAKIKKGEDVRVTIDRGFVELVPTFRGDYKFNGLKNINLQTSFNALVRYEFEITVETSGETSGEIFLPLFKKKSFPVRIPGPVPVYMDIEVEFPAGVKIATKEGGKSTFRLKSEYSLNADMSYDSKKGKSVKSYYDYVINDRSVEKSSATNSYLFELYFEPRLETKLYRVMGPYAYINANIQADVKLPLKESEKDIFANFSGGVGVTFSEPIFKKTLVDIKSASLFNFSKGWDVIGPKRKGAGAYQVKSSKEVELEVLKLEEGNRIALNLRPKSMSPLGKVTIFKQPEFGRLALGKNFDSKGIAYYYPPKVVEGRDSFQIQLKERGAVSEPSRIVLQLSDDAKKQASLDVKSIPDYVQEYNAHEVQNAIEIPSSIYKGEYPKIVDEKADKGNLVYESVVMNKLSFVKSKKIMSYPFAKGMKFEFFLQLKENGDFVISPKLKYKGKVEALEKFNKLNEDLSTLTVDRSNLNESEKLLNESVSMSVESYLQNVRHGENLQLTFDVLRGGLLCSQYLGEEETMKLDTNQRAFSNNFYKLEETEEKLKEIEKFNLIYKHLKEVYSICKGQSK